MSKEKFQKYWREVHGPLVAKHATTLKVLRYNQVHTLDDPLNDAMPEGRGKILPIYEGVEEWWCRLYY